MASETQTTFQRIAIPRIRGFMAAGIAAGAVAALFTDPANMNSMALFGGGGLAGAMLGLMASVMTSEPVWKARH